MTGAKTLWMCYPDGTLTNHFIIADDEYPDWHDDPETELWDCYAIPDWPRDVGAALALCLDWAAASQNMNRLRIYHSVDKARNMTIRADFHCYHQSQGIWYIRHDAIADTPALALCKLWLTATEGTDDEPAGA